MLVSLVTGRPGCAAEQTVTPAEVKSARCPGEENSAWFKVAENTAHTGQGGAASAYSKIVGRQGGEERGEHEMQPPSVIPPLWPSDPAAVEGP